MAFFSIPSKARGHGHMGAGVEGESHVSPLSVRAYARSAGSAANPRSLKPRQACRLRGPMRGPGRPRECAAGPRTESGADLCLSPFTPPPAEPSQRSHRSRAIGGSSGGSASLCVCHTLSRLPLRCSCVSLRLEGVGVVRKERVGAARRAAPKGSHERLLGHPNPPDELGGNSPHCAGDRVLETTVVVGGGCEAARGAKRGAGEVLETTVVV